MSLLVADTQRMTAGHGDYARHSRRRPCHSPHLLTLTIFKAASARFSLTVHRKNIAATCYCWDRSTGRIVPRQNRDAALRASRQMVQVRYTVGLAWCSGGRKGRNFSKAGMFAMSRAMGVTVRAGMRISAAGSPGSGAPAGRYEVERSNVCTSSSMLSRESF